MYSLMGMVAEVTANFGPFCTKDGCQFLLGEVNYPLILDTCRGREGDSSVESVGYLGGHHGGCCGGSGDQELELLDLSILVL